MRTCLPPSPPPPPITTTQVSSPLSGGTRGQARGERERGEVGRGDGVSEKSLRDEHVQHGLGGTLCIYHIYFLPVIIASGF